MLKTDIRLDLSLRKNFDTNDPHQILEVLNDNLSTTRNAIDFSMTDDEGVVSDGSARFTEIYYERGRVLAVWAFKWSVYAACQDHYYEAESNGSAELWISDNALCLKSVEYPEKPSTVEEF